MKKAFFTALIWMVSIGAVAPIARAADPFEPTSPPISGEAPALQPRSAATTAEPTFSPDESMPDLPKPKARLKKKARRLASLDGSHTSSTRVRNPRVPRDDRDTFFRFGALLGVSTLKSADPNTQSALSQNKTDSNTYAGINGDFRSHWFGVELDGFYGLASPQPVTLNDPTSGATSDGTSSVQQYGLVVSPKVQTTLYTGAVKWTPKLGLGFGLMGLKMTTLANDPNFANASPEELYQAMGVFGTAGIDVEFGSFAMLQLDYGRSLVTTGSYVTLGNNISADSASFDRIRAGLYFQVFQRTYLGSQYVQRGLNIEFSSTSGLPSQQNSQSQILGVFMYEL